MSDLATMDAPEQSLEDLVASDSPAPPAAWTPEHVALCLVEAFRTLDRMPRVATPRQTGNHWPVHRLEWADHLAQAELPEEERRERQAIRNALSLRPDAAAIARMDAALEWLRDLRAVDTGLALVTSYWALRVARRRSIRRLCREKGWVPATFYKLRARALDHLAEDLNARGVAVF